MTETADTYFGFGNKHHLGDWQRRHSLFFLPVVTPQTLGRHAQTRADLADTRRHAQTRADTRRLGRLGTHAQTRADLADTWQTLGRHWQTLTRAETTHLASGKRQASTPRETLRVHTLGFRQEGRHAHTRRDHERHFGSTHLASGKRQARGETRSHAQRAQTRGTPRETSRVHTLGRADLRETTRDPSSAHLDDKNRESVRRRKMITTPTHVDVQNAIFPVTPLFAYFLYTQIHKNRSQCEGGK